MTAFNGDVLILLAGAFLLGLIAGWWLRQARPPREEALPGGSSASTEPKPEDAPPMPPPAPTVAQDDRPVETLAPAAAAEAPAEPATGAGPSALPGEPDKADDLAAAAAARTADLFGHLLTGGAPTRRANPPASPAPPGGGTGGSAGAAAPAAHPGSKPPILAAPEGAADDLKQLKGIGPQNEQRLNALGIYHFRQIAAWTPEQVAWVGSYLAFPGRIERENWIDQARALAGEGAPGPSAPTASSPGATDDAV